jgi:hypothetical protein
MDNILTCILYLIPNIIYIGTIFLLINWRRLDYDMCYNACFEAVRSVKIRKHYLVKPSNGVEIATNILVKQPVGSSMNSDMFFTSFIDKIKDESIKITKYDGKAVTIGELFKAYKQYCVENNFIDNSASISQKLTKLCIKKYKKSNVTYYVIWDDEMNPSPDGEFIENLNN